MEASHFDLDLKATQGAYFRTIVEPNMMAKLSAEIRDKGMMEDNMSFADWLEFSQGLFAKLCSKFSWQRQWLGLNKDKAEQWSDYLERVLESGGVAHLEQMTLKRWVV